MTRDVSMEAEQALLGAVLVDEEALDMVGDLFRPELFAAQPWHAAIAREVVALRASQQPIDPVLVSQRLAGKAPPAAALELARAVGTSGNPRHYAETLESLWARREAKKIAAEMLRSDLDVRGEEFVATFAQRLSAIETRRARPSRRLSEVMFERLERREAIQKNPALLTDHLWSTGFRSLDGLVGGFVAGQLFTIAARPGVGKTAFVSALLDSLGERGIPVGLFQLEDYADAMADRAFMRQAGIASTMMRDSVRWEPYHWRKAGDAVNGCADWPIHIDDQHGRSIHETVGAMRRMSREHGVKVFFLDNLAEVVIDSAERGEERLDRALGRIAKTYRDAAKALGAAAVLVVHLNREVERRQDPKPKLSDLKNSGEIEDASHVVAMLSRAPDSDALVVDLAKNRNGPTAEVELEYAKELMAVRERSAA